jgi:S-methylmethionine-dependent homocysteine/selenocysteine methylase
MQEIIPLLNESKAKAISFNCIPPVRLQKLLAQTEIKFEWGCYCNCGRGAYGSGAMNNVLTPEEYAEEMKRILSLQPRQPLFIGSCCGSNPDHTRALRNLLNNINENNN